MKNILSLLLICIYTASFCQDWPQHRGPELNGSARLKFAANLMINSQAWEYIPERGVPTAPVVWKKNVYIGQGTSYYCLNKIDGTLKWKYKFQDLNKWSGQTSQPVINAGTLYFGSKEGRLFALDAETGNLKWMSAGEEMITSTPAVSHGMVYYSAWDQKFHALDINTGKEIWNFQTGGGDASPLVVGDHVYVGSDDGTIYALSAAEGKLSWTFKTGKMIYGSPVYHEGLLFFGSYDANLYALRQSTGTIEWTYTLGERITDSPTLYEGILIVSGYSGGIVALDARTGTTLWTRKMPVNSQPVVHNGTVLIGAADAKFNRNLHAIEIATGEDRFLHRVMMPSDEEVVISDGRLYISAGNLTAHNVYYEKPTPVVAVDQTKIGAQIWATENLSKIVFNNNDTIPQAKTMEEWKKATIEKKPAWCYYNFSEPLGQYFGVIYNVFAITDPRGLAPKGWRIPDKEDWLKLVEFVGKDQAWDKLVIRRSWMQGITTSNSTQFSTLAGGALSGSSFGGLQKSTGYWTLPKSANELQNTTNIYIGIDTAPGVNQVYGNIGDGLYVRVIKNQ